MYRLGESAWSKSQGPLRAHRWSALWCSLSLAFLAGPLAFADGFWARSGRTAASTGKRAAFPAPDRKSRLEIESGAVRFVGANGVRVDLELNVLAPPPLEIIWAPNGRAFAINASDGGSVGTWTTRVFSLNPAAQPVALDVQALVLNQARDFPQCEERKIPNIAAVSWAPGSFQLFVVAESPPHSSCRNPGELRGFRVSLEPLRIEATLTEAELRTKWSGLLGRRLADRELHARDDWPAVRPVEVRKWIEAGNAKVRVAIRSTSDEVLYELRCNEQDAEESEDEGGEEYYGMFQCRLREKAAGDLLRAGADWEDNYTTRGVFGFEQVVGPCRSDRYFGLRRAFHLRGMKLMLEISGFESEPVAELLAQASKPHFRFNFDVSIAPDPDAKALQAANPPGPYCNGIFILDGSGKAVYEKALR